MKISICVPTYEMRGKGAECLEFSFQRINDQNFTDFNVVISDSSIDDKIQLLCKKWQEKLDIKYIKSPECAGSATLNSTKAIKNCDGEWIKFLCIDDYLLNKNSLATIVGAVDENYKWLVGAYVHTTDRINFEHYHLPKLNPYICVVNTIGSPSCLTLKNTEDFLGFDDNLRYAYDCELYYRMIQKYGEPKIMSEATVITLLSSDSLTSTIMTPELIHKENDYILRKHGFIQ
jgi:glycosyltransferase involved in cell wall biosynthesis